MGAPPPAPGADAPMADAGAWRVKFTVLEGPGGEFALVTGDEPEMMDTEGGEPGGPKFPDFPGVVRAMIENVEGGGAEGSAQKGFEEGFDKGSMANDKRPMMDMERGG